MLRAATTVGCLFLWSTTLVTATLRGTRDLQHQPEEVDRASLDLPGVSIDLPSPSSSSSSGSGITSPIQIGGSSTDSTASGDNSSGIVIGNNSVSIGGTTIVSWGSNSTNSATCDNLPSTSLRDEPTCETALPAFYNATTEEKFNDMSSRKRNRVVDDFCGTKCGQVFTARTVATRLKCDGRSNKPDDTADVDSGVIPSQNISIGEGISVGIPGFVNITLPGSKRGGRLLAVDPKLEPDFSDEFPGLFLGCIKDSSDNSYCAVKRADPGERECEFYKSCCYAELNAITSIDLSTAASIEMKCPGSTIYRMGSLCTA